MDRKFTIGKTYKFDVMKYILLEGLDDFKEHSEWIVKCLDEFTVEENRLYNNDCDYLYSNDYIIGKEWCICVEDKIHFLSMIKDTYGATVVIYRDEDGKIKTKHYKLFEELLEKQLTNK